MQIQRFRDTLKTLGFLLRTGTALERKKNTNIDIPTEHVLCGTLKSVGTVIFTRRSRSRCNLLYNYSYIIL